METCGQCNGSGRVLVGLNGETRECGGCGGEGELFLTALVEEQPAPIPNAGTPVWDLVIADMKARDAIGRERYGTPLQAHNGRDSLVDAYQEALDLVVYLRAAIEERASKR